MTWFLTILYTSEIYYKKFTFNRLLIGTGCHFTLYGIPGRFCVFKRAEFAWPRDLSTAGSISFFCVRNEGNIPFPRKRKKKKEKEKKENEKN